MNPCPKYKRSIAWLASGAADETEAPTLRQHLETCPACRRYWQSMSELSEQLAHAGDLPPAEPAAAFHGRVVQAIHQRAGAAPFLDWIRAVLRLWPERRLAALSAAVVIGIAAVIGLQQLRPGKRPPVPRMPTPIVRHTPSPAPPTLAVYRRAAETSLEALDALLAAEAVRNAPKVETFTISSLLAHADP